MAYEYDDEDIGSGRVLLGRIAFWGTLLVLVFVLGRCSSPGVPESSFNETQDQVVALSSENESLRNELTALQSGGTDGEPTPTGPEDPDAGDPDADPDATDDPAGDGDADGETYVVESGDTLGSIALEFYGDDSQFGVIAEANGLEDGAELQVGQELEIPPEPDE